MVSDLSCRRTAMGQRNGPQPRCSPRCVRRPAPHEELGA